MKAIIVAAKLTLRSLLDPPVREVNEPAMLGPHARTETRRKKSPMP